MMHLITRGFTKYFSIFPPNQRRMIVSHLHLTANSSLRNRRFTSIHTCKTVLIYLSPPPEIWLKLEFISLLH